MTTSIAFACIFSEALKCEGDTKKAWRAMFLFFSLHIDAKTTF